MGVAELGLALVSGGLGYILADGLDRFLATYDPTAAERPKDKFTSDGAGTLANTFNVASPPSWLRLGAGVGAVALPAVGAAFVDQPLVKSSLEGATVGAGVSLFKTLWNNFLMPMLLGKDTTTPALQKSFIARLYPAEVAAKLNLDAKQQQVSSGGQAGALSGADVGPFAVAGSPEYPDAAQALLTHTGVQDAYPSVQNTWGTGGPSNYPTAAQAMGTGASPAGGVPYSPGPPPGTGPGPQAAPHTDPACGCIGSLDMASPFLGDQQEESPFVN